MFTLYSMQRSGNSYKARLALAQLRVPYRLIEVDILKGESHTPEFLTKNPNGQVPLLEVAPGRYLAESNAILWYIAGGTPLAPEDRIDRADALQWMFFEQHSLEPNLGAAYFWLTLIKGGRDLQRHAFEEWMEEGHRALGVMDKHLARHEKGTQDPIRTLKLGSGSCRDLAVLMIAALRSLGIAARFVSGYLNLADYDDRGAGGNTHAWVQAYVPGPGWVDFDPSSGMVGNRNLVRVAVVCEPREAIPLHGTWIGTASDHLAMKVAVKVMAAADAGAGRGAPACMVR